MTYLKKIFKSSLERQENDITSESYRNQLLSDGEISILEFGFLQGYQEAQ